MGVVDEKPAALGLAAPGRGADLGEAQLAPAPPADGGRPSAGRAGPFAPTLRRRARSVLRWAPYLLPAIVLTALFVVYPSIDAVRLSLSEWPGYGDATWIGFDNYAELFKDDVFYSSTLRSLIFATIVTVGTVTIGAAMAVLFDRGLPGHGIFQFLVFLPVILPNTFIAVAWATGLDPYIGWVEPILHIVDPGAQANWLGGSAALYVVAAVAILQFTGFPMIVILGALSKVSPEIHEAATLEGVNGWRRARAISLPLVKDVIAAVALLQFVWQFSAFEYIFVMTNGGPGTATEVSATFVYHQAFVDRLFGYASAAAVAGALFVGTLVMLYMTLLRPKGIERAG